MEFQNKQELFDFLQQLSDNQESLQKDFQQVKESQTPEPQNGGDGEGGNGNEQNTENQDPGGQGGEEETEQHLDEIEEFLDV